PAQPDPVPIRVSAPAPVRASDSAPAAETFAPQSTSTEIRTLSDPPEIWDLVHEVPRNFNARSAFATRLQSMRSGWAFRVAAAMIVVAMSVVGVLVLRGVQARSEKNSAQQAQASPQTKTVQSESAVGNPQAVSNSGWQAVTDNSSQPNPGSLPATPAAPAVADNPTALPTINANEPSVVVRKQGSRASFMSSHRVRAAREGFTEAVDQPPVVAEKPEAS